MKVMVLRREASARHHLVAKVLVLLRKSHSFMGGGHGWIRVYFSSARCENGHMLIYLSKTMCEIASGSKSVGFTQINK